MSLQVEILSDVIRHERFVNESPRQVEHRRAARLLEAVNCCTRPSLAARLLGLLDGRAANCCVNG